MSIHYCVHVYMKFAEFQHRDMQVSRTTVSQRQRILFRHVKIIYNYGLEVTTSTLLLHKLCR